MTTYADIQRTENEGDDFDGYTRAQLAKILRGLREDRADAMKMGHRADASSYLDDIHEITAILR